ncbi:MAG: Flp family type IVb pilin [Anaerolineales bacterium]|nr:Flp family type IVb pilin [Anaerolineales bacterium]
MRFAPHERGQGFLEYALLLILIAIVIILVLTIMGTRLSRMYSQISSTLPFH